MPLPPPSAPFFSIIIPLYNNEKVLHQCLDSIISQSFSDFEAIIVDDGSTDKSRQIAERYQREDSRVKVIAQDNQGALIARNHGVDAASGEYLIFVDSDDILATGSLEVIHDTLVSEECDILQYTLERFMDGDVIERFPVHLEKSKHPDMLELINLLLNYRIPSLCTKAIKRIIYNAIPVPSQRVNIGEDYLTVFSLIAMDLKWCIIETDNPVYLYRQYPSASISRKRLEELSTFDDVCFIRSAMLYYFQRADISEDIIKKFCDNFLIAILENIFYMAKAKKGVAHLNMECRKLFESDVYKYIQCRDNVLSSSGFKWKFEYFLMKRKMIPTLYFINRVFTYFC